MRLAAPVARCPAMPSAAGQARHAHTCQHEAAQPQHPAPAQPGQRCGASLAIRTPSSGHCSQPPVALISATCCPSARLSATTTVSCPPSGSCNTQVGPAIAVLWQGVGRLAVDGDVEIAPDRGRAGSAEPAPCRRRGLRRRLLPPRCAVRRVGGLTRSAASRPRPARPARPAARRPVPGDAPLAPNCCSAASDGRCVAVRRHQREAPVRITHRLRRLPPRPGQASRPGPLPPCPLGASTAHAACVAR